jgi:hypothetical protein
MVDKIHKNARDTAESQQKLMSSTHEHTERAQAIGFYGQYVEVSISYMKILLNAVMEC